MANFWNSPSTVVFILLRSTPSTSRSKQLVPLPAPYHLDDVPPGAAEGGLELLDDLAVAPDRAVEALQVAVDDEDQVVQLLAGRQRQGPEGLGLVALTVAEEAPHPALRGVGDPAVLQVAVEVGLVDGVERAEPHRDGRELPEIRHQSGVGVGRQAARAGVTALELAAEVFQLVLAQPPLHVGPGVDARGGVALEINLVAGLPVGLAPEEVVEADLIQAGRAGEGGQMAADPLGRVVGPHHHDGGVPADVGPDAALDVLVAGEPGLLVGRDGVDVRRRDGGGKADLVGPGPLEELHEQEASPGLAVGVEDGIEGVDPFRRLLRIDVR